VYQLDFLNILQLLSISIYVVRCYTLEALKKFEDKKNLISYENSIKSFEDLTHEQTESLWNKLTIEKVTLSVPCYESTTRSGDVESFWSSCSDANII
jgi:hypothetical protein